MVFRIGHYSWLMEDIVRTNRQRMQRKPIIWTQILRSVHTQWCIKFKEAYLRILSYPLYCPDRRDKSFNTGFFMAVLFQATR